MGTPKLTEMEGWEDNMSVPVNIKITVRQKKYCEHHKICISKITRNFLNKYIKEHMKAIGLQ